MGSWKEAPIGSCCYECKERFPACHDVCATYLEAKANWEEQKKKIKQAQTQEWNIDHYHYRRVQQQRVENMRKGKRY